jgi:hypothetical protein
MKATASGVLPPGEVSGTSIANHFCSSPSHFCDGTSASSICTPTPIDLDAIRNASILNALYIRFDVWWDAIEPTAPSQFSQCAIQYYSQIVSYIKSQGLKAIAIVGTSEPSWVTSGCGCELSAATSYASWVAQNLGSGIDLYQLGNELNWVGHPAGGTSSQYVSQYIVALAQGIQSGQPVGHTYQTLVNTYADVEGLLGCTATGNWHSSLQAWLNAAGNYINIIAIDHYPGYFCLTTSWSSDGFLSSLANLASVNGKGYGVTETGFPAYCALYYCSPPIEQQQDTFASQTLSWVYGFAQGEASAGNPLLFFGWYQLTDKNACSSVISNAPWDCQFGLQPSDTTNRPAFQTVATYFHELIGYPVVFAESSLNTGTNWCVIFNNQNQCGTGSLIRFNAQPGTYSFSVAISGCGQSCQYIPTQSSGSITMGFAAVSQTVAFIKQYQITFAYYLVGGGTGYSPPVLTYRSNGASQTATLGASPFSVYVDASIT